jgi:hypothetical protein
MPIVKVAALMRSMFPVKNAGSVLGRDRAGIEKTSSAKSSRIGKFYGQTDRVRACFLSAWKGHQKAPLLYWARIIDMTPLSNLQ